MPPTQALQTQLDPSEASALGPQPQTTVVSLSTRLLYAFSAKLLILTSQDCSTLQTKNTSIYKPPQRAIILITVTVTPRRKRGAAFEIHTTTTSKIYKDNLITLYFSQLHPQKPRKKAKPTQPRPTKRPRVLRHIPGPRAMASEAAGEASFQGFQVCQGFGFLGLGVFGFRVLGLRVLLGLLRGLL